MWSKQLALLCFIVLLPLTSFAAEDVYSLLDRMSGSFRELNYQGVFSYQQGENLQSLRIAHAVIDGEEYERLEYMDGEPREVVRRGKNLAYILPSQQLVRLSALQYQQEATEQPSQGVARYYQLSVVGRDRVAGRQAIKLVFSPKDKHRFSHHIALDEETGLLLRSALVGENNEVLERFQFVDLTFDDEVVQSSFSAGMPTTQPYIEPSNAPIPAPKSWQVQWLPGGYSEVAAADSIGDDMASFSDGLAVFSVFLAPDVGGERATVEGYSQRGATIAYSRPLLLQGHPHRVTVVGEIPQQTARQVAQSIVLVAAQ